MRHSHQKGVTFFLVGGIGPWGVFFFLIIVCLFLVSFWGLAAWSLSLVFPSFSSFPSFPSACCFLCSVTVKRNEKTKGCVVWKHCFALVEVGMVTMLDVTTMNVAVFGLAWTGVQRLATKDETTADMDVAMVHVTMVGMVVVKQEDGGRGGGGRSNGGRKQSGCMYVAECGVECTVDHGS